MFAVEKYKGPKEEQFNLVVKQLTALIEDEDNMIANLSNASALLNQFLERINWVGFYLWDEEKMNSYLDRFKGCRHVCEFRLVKECAGRLRKRGKLWLFRM